MREKESKRLRSLPASSRYLMNAMHAVNVPNTAVLLRCESFTAFECAADPGPLAEEDK